MLKASPAGRLSALSLCLACVAVLAGGRLPGQLIPKVLTPAAQEQVPTRLSGAWEGTARETGADHQDLQYALAMTFTGDDAALGLDVSATAKLPIEGGQTVTVEIRANYLGSLQGGRLSMRSDRITVRVVETGELVPSSSQQVEGKLENGVLTGRVGSEVEGWTSFTVRPKGGRRGPEPVAQQGLPQGFTGRWRGTCREMGPDQKEISYSITLEFTGRAEDLSANVAADMRYPMQDGSSTAVEYRATFRGSAAAAEMQLRSEKVEIRLPELRRNNEGPTQELTGRFEQGVLTARIRSPGQADAQLELRPDGVAREAKDGRDPTIDGGSNPFKANTPASPYRTLILERREVRDPGLAGIVSHTLLVPKGWDFAGEVTWTANQDSFVVFDGTMHGPGRESLHFGRPRQFSYQTVTSQFGQQDDNRGQQKPDGSFARKAPRGPGEVAVEVILPELRPQASQMQVVDAARQPDLEAKVRELHKDHLASLEAIARLARSSGAVAVDNSVWLVVERTRVRYEEGGTQWEEEVRCTMIGMHGTVRSEAMSTENGFWTLRDVTTARAPVGQLDARLATLWTLAGCLQQTPRWNAAVSEIRLAIMKAQTESLRANFEAIKQRGEMLARSQAELSDIQMQGWRSQNATSDRIHKATIETLRGVHDFRDAEGQVHTVTNLYDRAFVNPKGNIILTSDPNYRPSGDPLVNQGTWDEMQRIDPFRGQAR